MAMACKLSNVKRSSQSHISTKNFLEKSISIIISPDLNVSSASCKQHRAQFNIVKFNPMFKQHVNIDFHVFANCFKTAMPKRYLCNNTRIKSLPEHIRKEGVGNIWCKGEISLNLHLIIRHYVRPEIFL